MNYHLILLDVVSNNIVTETADFLCKVELGYENFHILEERIGKEFVLYIYIYKWTMNVDTCSLLMQPYCVHSRLKRFP